jgi:hypothetical protein
MEDTMPRYLVERSFPDGLAIPIDEGGAKTCQVVVDHNTAEGVTWVHSYVTPTGGRPSVSNDGR